MWGACSPALPVFEAATGFYFCIARSHIEMQSDKGALLCDEVEAQTYMVLIVCDMKSPKRCRQ